MNQTTGEVAKELRCSNCKYNLQGLSDNANCPECGESVALSIVFAEWPRMAKREGRIIQKEDRYRRDRQGAFGLGIMAIIGTFVSLFVFAQAGAMPDDVAYWKFTFMTTNGLMGGLIITAIGYAMHARYQHARSARLYREYLARSQ